MSANILESDWKILRGLQPLALDRFCRRVLGEIEKTIDAEDRSAHERYLEIFRLLRHRDGELARSCDDLRRSNAIFKLTAMRAQGVLTDEEFGRFSDETRGRVDAILSLDRD